MKTPLFLTAFCFLASSTILFAQQPANYQFPKRWANDTLQANDPCMAEMPTRSYTADEVLNGTIKWKNPYATIQNTATAGFDFSKFGKTPKAGIYPRLLTSPAEFQAIKSRLETTETGRQMLKVANAQIAEMRAGKGASGKLYAKLLAGQTVEAESEANLRSLTNILSVQGLLAQLFNDKALLKETATVSANLLKALMYHIDATPQVPGLEAMVKESVYGGARMSKLFDFTAAGMSEADKKLFIDFMVRETKGKYGDGMQLPTHWRRWNHIASAISYPLAVLAAEGQQGYDKRIYDRGVEVAHDYLSYTFTQEGMSPEGMTYTFGPFYDVLQYMTAISRRGKTNLFANPHFRAIPDWLIYALAPNPDALWSSHGDTGSNTRLNWYMLMYMKYYFPNDTRLDYLLANALPRKIDEIPDVSAFLVVNDPVKTAAEYNGIPPVKLPNTFFSPERGSFIARDKWSRDGVMFQFDGRQDMLYQSHDHSDKGNFMLFANGRPWVVDGWRSTETKYHSAITIDGRGQGYFPVPAQWLGFVDKPEATFGIIDYKYAFDWMWLKSPVADIMLGKKVADKWQNGVYGESAKKLMQYYPGIKPERDPLRKVADYFGGNMATNPLIWKEDTWPMRLPNYKVEHAFRTAGLVKGTHNYMLIVDDLKKDNQERLYEWNMPMPLDVEVVAIRQLVEVTQGAAALNIGFNSFSGKGVSGEYDIVLGDKRMERNMKEVDNANGEKCDAGRFTPKTGDPQLLVRVLERTPAPRPNLEPNPRLEVIEKLKTEDMHQFYLRTMDIGKRLVIPSRSSDPNFKVLIVPYMHGEEMPQTTWSENRTRLRVEWSNQKDEFFFSKGENGRTKVKLVRDGKLIFDL